MANTRISSLVHTETFDDTDFIAIDGQNGTQGYPLSSLKSALLSEANENATEIVENRISETETTIINNYIKWNPFNFDYTNVFTYPATVSSFTVPCDGLFELNQSLSNDFSINGRYLSTYHTAWPYYFSQNFGNISHFQFFLEAGDKITKSYVRTDSNTTRSFLIPLRHGNFAEELISSASLPLSVIFENMKETTETSTKRWRKVIEEKALSDVQWQSENGAYDWNYDTRKIFSDCQDEDPMLYYNCELSNYSYGQWVPDTFRLSADSEYDIKVDGTDIVVAKLKVCSQSGTIALSSDGTHMVKLESFTHPYAFGSFTSYTKDSTTSRYVFYNCQIGEMHQIAKGYIAPSNYGLSKRLFTKSFGDIVFFPKDQCLKFQVIVI